MPENILDRLPPYIFSATEQMIEKMRQEVMALNQLHYRYFTMIKNNRLKSFLLIFLLLPFQVISQISMTGSVTEASGNLPVPYATVYVNGTHNGTITDASGQFSLDKVTLPCEIVISHISYETEVIVFTQHKDTTLQIRLKPKEVKIEPVDIVSQSRRDENLRHFRDRFLGTDYWGKHAYIENDSVLIFHRVNAAENERYDQESFLLPADSSSTLFTVNTKGPMLVNLPLLGYKLHINLIHYTEVLAGNDKTIFTKRYIF